jgi:2-polyprenyl-3-methyl-5-hydroxy-6-metoxy-1,4-benzoquinol methylase
METIAAIDQPVRGSLNDPLSLCVEGWLHAGPRDPELAAVEICAEEKLLGETALRFARPDVARSLGLPADTATGFALHLSAPALFGKTDLRLECRARFRDGSSERGAFHDIKLIAHDHRQNHYGALADPDESRLYRREDIYCTGPSVSDTNADCLALIRRYLGPPPVRVLDVGCGFGSYGRALRAEGHDWFGVEVKASDCAELARLGLPHRHVDGKGLPFAVGSFDATICIEVLEHIAEPEAFLTEVRRVCRRRLLVSVPNLEMIPYFHRHLSVPWHLLEGDHKNFFTRASLRHLLGRHFRQVEVLTYGRHPLTTPEGLPLHYHLFAVCDL